MESYVWSLFVLEAPPEWQWPLPARQRIREAHLEEEAPRKIHLDRRGFLHNFHYYQQQYCHAFKPSLFWFFFSLKNYPLTSRRVLFRFFFFWVVFEYKTLVVIDVWVVFFLFWWYIHLKSSGFLSLIVTVCRQRWFKRHFKCVWYNEIRPN